jgi:hypothetical protein
MYSTMYLSTYPLCKTRHLTPQYNTTVHKHKPRAQISFSQLFIIIIICPHTFHILAFYNDRQPLIYSFKRSYLQCITIQMHAKLVMHSRHLHAPRGRNFSSNFFGTLSVHIPLIFLLMVIIGSLVEVFQ